MNIQETLKNAINSGLLKLSIKDAEINIEHPENSANGDFSTNIALSYAKKIGENPRNFAEKMVAEILKNKPKEIEKIEIAGPGFINFYLTKEFFAEEIKKILKEGKNFGFTKIFAGQKIFIEHTQPNPFKQFHIGHLMNNAVGESINRLIRANGAKVKTATYHGDVGLHVAKTIYAVLKESADLKSFKTLEEKVKFLGKKYSEGDQAYEDNKIEIENINKKIFDGSDKEINKIYKWGREASLDYFEKIYKKLGSKFDYHFYESDAGKIGKKIVEENIGKVFEKSEGAVIFKGENFGFHTRVFINKDNLPTYEAKEVGLATIKRKKFNYHKSVTVTANEQDSFFKVVESAIGEIFPELKGKLMHISHGMIKLPSGKMSSRTGTVILAEDLIEETKKKVLEKIADRDFNDSEKSEISEAVSIGAIRYTILKQGLGNDIIFDFEKSLSFEGDSGPYLQYSYARAKSILRKAEQEKVYAQVKSQKSKEEGETLEKALIKFPEIVERAGKEFSPHYIATYLIELASIFNNFYSKGKIVDPTDVNSSYKVALTESFSIVMKNGLNLLGIVALERM